MVALESLIMDGWMDHYPEYTVWHADSIYVKDPSHLDAKKVHYKLIKQVYLVGLILNME